MFNLHFRELLSLALDNSLVLFQHRSVLRDSEAAFYNPSSPQHPCLPPSLLYRFWLPPISQYRLRAPFMSPFLCCGLEMTVSWSSQGVCLCFLLSDLTQVSCHGERVNPVSHLNHEQTQTGLNSNDFLKKHHSSAIDKYRNVRDSVDLESRAEPGAALLLTLSVHTEGCLSLTLVGHVSL